jgi:dihydroorotate dehydrogenase (NAD+) catalytic subunit
VAIGAANFVNPCSMQEIASGLESYLQSRGLNHVSQLVGQIKIEG